MAEVRLKKLLRLYKLRDSFDPVILAVHVCLVERGFHCISCGEERNEEQECDFGETLPPSWNSLDDVYTLQYRKGNLNSVYIFKALKLGRKLAIYFMEEDESRMYDTNLDVDHYTVSAVDYNSFQHTQQLQTVDGIFRQLDRLKTKLFKDLVDKFTTDTRTARHHEETRENRADNQREQPSQLIDDDPLRIPPRRPPDFSREWERPPVGPFGYGDGDRLPGLPGTSGGMLMDPFRSGGMGSMGMYGPQPHPGQLPRGAVPPGARFDPFGPVPPGRPNPDSRSGQFSRPDPDHLPPPGYDDMFM